MIDNRHPLLGMAQAEHEDIKDCGEEEQGEDDQGRHEGGLGKRQWVGCLTKLPWEQIFDTEATPIDIEDIPHFW